MEPSDFREFFIYNHKVDKNISMFSKNKLDKINIIPHNIYQYLQMHLFFHPDKP
ncbi:hypothetical protein BH18THE2_BH18THE2_35910 [soil metagenome]